MGEPGTCRLLLGPMFANKTTRLVQELNTIDDLGKRVLYVNHQRHGDRDTRVKDAFVSSHNEYCGSLSPSIDRRLAASLDHVDVSSYDVIGVDEGQFFETLDARVREWVFDDRKIVIVSSLDSDSSMRPFGSAHALECICTQENIVRLCAFCASCLERGELVPASFTKCTAEKSSQVMVGGKNCYQPACMRCF